MTVTPIATDEARRPAGGRSVRNGILAALPDSEYECLLSKIERVTLHRGECIYRADQRIKEVYFPEGAVVAMVDSLGDRRTVEVGVVGHEGMVGINIFLGGFVTPDKAIVQIPGEAIRMKSKDLRNELHNGSSLSRLLFTYTRALLAVISQSVACCQHHSIEQRLARWLLSMHHYSAGAEFVMIQQSIAAMLGVRREGITEAAIRLHALSLISYRRGHISILDELALRKKACECYRFIQNRYVGLYAELSQFSHGR